MKSYAKQRYSNSGFKKSTYFKSKVSWNFSPRATVTIHLKRTTTKLEGGMHLLRFTRPFHLLSTWPGLNDESWQSTYRSHLAWPAFLLPAGSENQTQPTVLVNNTQARQAPKKNWQGVPPYITFNTKKTKSSSGQTIWQKSGTFSNKMSPNFQISCKTSWKLYPLSDPSKVDPSARVQKTLWPKILSRAWIANTRFFERSPFLRSLGLMMPSRTLSKGDYYVKNSFLFSFFF